MLKIVLAYFGKKTPAQLAADELAQAERELLQWQTQREHADSQVQFNEARIKRLKKVLAGLEKESQA